MKKVDFHILKQILSQLSGKADEFYLAGGTALSMFYFQHRESHDLDFFTKTFSKDSILRVTRGLQAQGLKVELIGEQGEPSKAKMMVFLLRFSGGEICKLDFVEDFIDLLKPLKLVDGIKILSLEDIYLRKIFAAAGHIRIEDITGDKIVVGGRQDAKDFYDLFCLSTIVMPLSDFVAQHANPTLKEGLIRWYRTYDRMLMKTELLELAARKAMDWRLMDQHFKKEIDTIISQEIGPVD